MRHFEPRRRNENKNYTESLRIQRASRRFVASGTAASRILSELDEAKAGGGGGRFSLAGERNEKEKRDRRNAWLTTEIFYLDGFNNSTLARLC